MQDSFFRANSTHSLARALAVVGTLLCLVVSGGAWLSLRQQQSLWSLPDLYLLEIPLLNGLAAWCIWNEAAGPKSARLILAWAAIGAMLDFVLLGAFSIGFFYLPSATLLAGAAILTDIRLGARTGQRRLGSGLLIHPGICIAAALAQAALMLAIIKMI